MLSKSERDVIREISLSRAWREDTLALLDDLDAKDALLAERDATIEVMRKALEPFASVAALNEPLGLPDATPLRNVIPGAWPTLGGLRVLIDALQPDAGAKLLADHAAEIERLQQADSEWQDACYRSGQRDAEEKCAAQLAAYRKALRPFAYISKQWRQRAIQEIPTMEELGFAESVLQSPDPGKAMLAEHAAELSASKLRAESAERLWEFQYAEGMKAHRWFARQFGEQMNGRDFDVKFSIADAELAALRQRAEAAEAALAKLQNERMPL